jgi:tetratricopeptide (TPR) repeat protein
MINDTSALQDHLNRMMSEDPNGPEAEKLLRRLTVFPGTFDAVAAVALSPLDMSEETVMKALMTLQQWGLLGRVALSEPLPIEARVLDAIPPQAETFATLQAWGFLERETVPTRYFLLKSVLRALPPDEDSLIRHYEYYRRLHGNLATSIQQERYALISADWPSLHAAIVWGMAHATRTVFDFAWALNAYMRDRLARDEWRTIVEALRNTAETHHKLAEQGNALTTLGIIAQLENDLETAENAFTEALGFYEQATTGSSQGLTTKIVDDLMEVEQSYEAALDLNAHVLDRRTARRDQLQRLVVLYRLHDVQVKRGEFAEARETLFAIMAIYQQMRDERGQCDTLINMGLTAAKGDDLVQARDDFAWGLRMGERADYAIGQMKALWAWGQVEYQNGNREAGCALCHQAIMAGMGSERLHDHARADELRDRLADMQCGMTPDGE